MTIQPASSNGSNFHSSGLRQKVDLLMDILWAGGVNNPMDSIEQLSYLIFLRLLSEKDELLASLDKKNYKRIFSGKWTRYAWGNFVTLTGDELFDSVRSAIESLHELPGLSETGKLLFNRATLKIYDRPTLRATVQSIHEMDLAPHGGNDLKGDMYEYLLSKLSMSGTNGQFRTPRHIINMIVAMVDPQPGRRVCDPACGTAGFLISTFNYILHGNTSKAALAKGEVNGDQLSQPNWRFLEEHAFTGYDNDANMVKIAILNLYLHRLEKANIEFHNPLTTGKGNPYPGLTFDVILANPPFAGKIQEESILADINLATRDTELLFLKWFIDHLNPGGRAGVIVPNGVLFGSNKADRKVRELLLTSCDLQAVVNLPSGVFKPYSGVGTAALIFENVAPGFSPARDVAASLPRHGGVKPPLRHAALKDGATEGAGLKPGATTATRSVWFYDLTADGFSLDDKRTPIEANDIPDVLAKWPGRVEGANSYCVPIERIRENDWSLAAGRYKPVRVETVRHDPPKNILKEVLALEEEIAERAKKLMGAV
jgi:type I restriction enzyme M protein